MTEMPTELMKPMEPRTHRAGSIASATRRTRELSAMSGGGFGVDGASAGSRRPASMGQEREGSLRGKQDDGGEQDHRLASGKAKGEERQEEEAVDRDPGRERQPEVEDGGRRAVRYAPIRAEDAPPRGAEEAGEGDEEKDHPASVRRVDQRLDDPERHLHHEEDDEGRDRHQQLDRLQRRSG